MAVYDAFISYSHAKDRPVATALQAVMQRLGKPWYGRRAVRVFRDDTSLSATPHLWPSIEEALRASRFFVLIASQEAAASKWVGREVAFWLENRSVETLLIGLTDGDLVWDEADGDFVAGDTSPLPVPLRGRFASEPKWVDLRGHRGDASSRNTRFIELGADFAAFVRGIPKEDLLSEEVRQQRRALRLAWSAAFGLLILSGAALWQWREAVTQRSEAVLQRDRAERTLAQATEATNELVYTLAERFRNSGVPARLIRSVLDTARTLQDQLIDGGYATPALRRSQGAALIATVKTLIALGDSDGAMDAADRARRIFERLIAEADTQARSLQNDLGVVYGQIGDVLYQEGRKTDALSQFRMAASVFERLAESDPADKVYRQHLAVAKTRIASLLSESGGLDEAFVLARDAVAARQRLARDDADPAVQHDLATSQAVLGGVLAQLAVERRKANDGAGFQERLGEAIASFRDAVAILEGILASDTNTAWSRDLALTYDKFGDALATQALYVDGAIAGLVKMQDALDAYRKGIAILTRLIASDESNVSWQQDLALIQKHRDDLLRIARQRD